MVTIHVAGTDGTNSATPFFVARKLGLFKAAGLDVDYTMVSGGGAAMAAALTSQSVDVALGAATQWMGDAAKGAIHGKIIGEFADNNYVIIGGNGITRPRQFKGKIFGVSSLNAGDQVYAQAVLSHFGVDPNDVVWLALGTPASRLSALRAGKVDGIEMTMTNLPVSERRRIVVDAESSPFPFVSSAIFAREGLIKGDKPALQRFLAAIGKGADWVRAHPKEAVPICEESGSPAEGCRIAIDVALASKNPYTWSSTTRVNTGAIEAMLPMVAAVVPQAKGKSVDDLVDDTIAGSRS